MDHDSPSHRHEPDGSHGQGQEHPEGPIETIRHERGTTRVYYSYDVSPPTPPWQVEHDREAGLFRLAGPRGQKDVFRNQAVRYLEVEVDPATGEMRPRIL